MFNKINTFWKAFVTALKKTFVEKDIDTDIQAYTDITQINFLSILVTKVSNLICDKAQIQVESESTQSVPLKNIALLLHENLSNITEKIASSGECRIFPSQTKDGTDFLWILSVDQVYDIDVQGDKIYESYAIVKTIKKKTQKFMLIRHHKLDVNGDLLISYNVYNEQGRPDAIEEFADINGKTIKYIGANHIGFGRYKSPVSSRGLTNYGVPLNFGCSEIEQKISQTMSDIDIEFKNAKSKIFADRSIAKPKNLIKGKEQKKIEYDIPDNMFLVDKPMGETGSLIDIFNPQIRYSEHYNKLMLQFELYEAQTGLSKGILSNNTVTKEATATEVRRSNSDTVALVDSFREQIDKGNIDTLKAFNMLYNVDTDLWVYTSDWTEPFESIEENWNRIIASANAGYIKPERVTQWLFPKMTLEEAQQEIEDIKSQNSFADDLALDTMLRR